MKSESYTQTFITSVDAAKHAGLSNDHVSRLCRQGKLTCTLVGKVWYVEESSLRNYLSGEKASAQSRTAELIQQRKAEYQRFLRVKEESAPVSAVRGATQMHRSTPQERGRGVLITMAGEAVLAGIILAVSISFGNFSATAQSAGTALRGGIASMPPLATVASSNLVARVESAFFSDAHSVSSIGTLITDAIRYLRGGNSAVTAAPSEPSAPHVSGTIPPASPLAPQGPIVAGGGSSVTSPQVVAIPAASPQRTVIERTVERVVQVATGVTEGTLDTRLQILANQLRGEIAKVSAASPQISFSGPPASTPATFQSVALTNKIDSLDGITLSNITFANGTTVTGLTDANIPDDITASNYLLLAGGTLSGALGNSSTATSSFSGGFSAPVFNASSTTATSTFANGIALTGGCFSVNGSCVTGGGGGSSASTTLLADVNTFSGANTFSSTTLSGMTLLTNATTTSFAVTGAGTSTFAGGLQTTALNVTSTSATSTFANGLNLTGGCFSINGTCVSASGSSASFGQAWELYGSAGYLAPTSTKGIIVAASSTIGAGTQQGGLTISGGATTTGNAYFAGNIGIGTTSPGQKLSVAGDILGNTIIGSYFTSTSTATASTFPYASTTALTVSGTNGLTLSSSLNGLLKATNGLVSAAVAGTDYASFAYPFISDATTTKLTFSGGLLSLASSTIGAGTQTTGLTISGGATTTGNAYFAGNILIGTTTSVISADGSSTAALHLQTSSSFPASFEGTGSYAGFDVNGIGASTVPFIQLNRGSNRILSITAETDNDTVNFRGGNAVATSLLTLIKSTGKVGIGTTSPSSYGKLTVESTPSAPTSYWDSSQATFRDNRAVAAGVGGGISFAGQYTSAGAEAQAAGLQARKTNNTSGDATFGLDIWARGGAINFNTTGAGTISSTPDVVINSSGYVGIGTTTPDRKLSIADTAYVQHWKQTDGTAGKQDFVLGFWNDALSFQAFDGANYVRELLHLEHDGNVGIGTTSPWRKLSVTDTSAQAALAYDSTRYTTFSTDAAGDLTITPQGSDVFLGDGNMWVCASGSCPSGTPSGTGNVIVETAVGIGSSSPFRPLDVVGSAAGNVVNIRNSNASGWSSIDFYDSSSLQKVTVGYGNASVGSFPGVGYLNANAVGLVFGISSTEKARLDSTGNFGIASSTPFAKLSIGADGSIVTTEKSLTDGATVAIDWSLGNQQKVTLGGNRTITFSNYLAGATLRLVACQDGTGSRTLTWPSSVLWAGGSAPTLTTTANKCDVLTFLATNATSTLKIFGSSVLSF